MQPGNLEVLLCRQCRQEVSLKFWLHSINHSSSAGVLQEQGFEATVSSLRWQLQHYRPTGINSLAPPNHLNLK